MFFLAGLHLCQILKFDINVNLRLYLLFQDSLYCDPTISNDLISANVTVTDSNGMTASGGDSFDCVVYPEH